jgi:thiol peroxidase
MPEERSVNERTGLVIFGGKPATLLGDELEVGEAAPDFTAVGNDLKPVALSQFKGKVVVVASVPSLDTPTCDLETRRFNAEAVKLGPDVVILTVSMDLPFAQKRWCGAAGVDRVITVSDHRDASFGTAYGVLVKDVRLLARAVFVVDRQGVIRYIQLVKETGKEPDYAPALDAVKGLQ